MEYIIPQHPYGTLSTQAERLTRLAGLDPEQLPMALTFLSGYHPRVFDAILTAVEPCAPPRAETADMEPFCVKCNAPVGVFQAHGPDYQHYRGLVTATSKPKPYKADHAPEIGWRPPADETALAAC